MSREEDGYPAGDEDVVQFGGARRRAARWPRWVFAAGLLLTGLLIWVMGPEGPAPGLPESGASSSEQSSTSEQLGATRPDFADTNAEVVGRAERSLIRLRLATGSITRTSVPSLKSSGPVYFVVTADTALIRPLDFVHGYRVEEGQPTRRLEGVFGRGGPILPGPNPRQVWVPLAQTPRSMRLVNLNGQSTGVTIRLPSSTLPAPDGNGYPMVTNQHGTYQVRQSGTRRITTGPVVAVGPTGWLAIECEPAKGCRYVLIDRGDHERHTASRQVKTPTYYLTGEVAPDGSTAALFTTGRTGKSGLSLLDLSTGRIQSVTDNVDARYATSTLAWSPDSRWLFLADGQLLAIDTRDTQIYDLGLRSHITQVAIHTPPTY